MPGAVLHTIRTPTLDDWVSPARLTRVCGLRVRCPVMASPPIPTETARRGQIDSRSCLCAPNSARDCMFRRLSRRWLGSFDIIRWLIMHQLWSGWGVTLPVPVTATTRVGFVVCREPGRISLYVALPPSRPQPIGPRKQLEPRSRSAVHRDENFVS